MGKMKEEERFGREDCQKLNKKNTIVSLYQKVLLGNVAATVDTNGDRIG